MTDFIWPQFYDQVYLFFRYKVTELSAKLNQATCHASGNGTVQTLQLGNDFEYS